MKKRMAAIAVMLCVLCAAFPVSVLAHSGRTDSSGGHRDNRNRSGLGSYHYHCGGYSPHLHNGGCPYAVVDEPEEEVIPTVSSVQIKDEISEIPIGGSFSVKSHVYPSDAEGRAVTWASSDSEIASVSKKGLITGKKAGYVTISAYTANGTQDSFELTINEIPVESVTLNKEKTSLIIEKKEKLKCSVLPKNATNTDVKWKTSDKSVAVVSKSGEVTGKKAGKLIAIKSGTATVTAIASGITESFEVEVYSNTAMWLVVSLLVILLGAVVLWYVKKRSKREE